MKLLRKTNGEWYQFVYLLESNGVYKIGFSRFPLGRVKSLQTGSPYPITMIHKIKTPYFRQLEAKLHYEFRDKRLHNEWFALTPEDVERFKMLNHAGRTPEEEAAIQASNETHFQSEEYAEARRRMRGLVDSLNARARRKAE
jgi:hypothetical protein